MFQSLKSKLQRGLQVQLWLVICFSCTQAYPANTYRDLDICNHWNGRRHFLELGERGELHARNVTTTAFRSTLFNPPSGSSGGNSIKSRNGSSSSVNVVNDIWYQCNLELVTCAECVIRITFTHANFSKNCANAVLGKSLRCPCEHIQFSEPPYDTTISGQEFCGDGKVFRSKTRTLLLKFFYRATNSHVFSLQYFSERNVKIISGSPRQSIIGNSNGKNAPQVISTPYFPMPYPRDYGIEHILTCEADSCQVRLDFTDFQLGLTSTLEIFDSNGQMLDSYTGEHFRPPITVSSGKSLLLQFRGNTAIGVGFRAEVSFVSAKQLKEERLAPYTDCGGMVTGPGGAITMMNMIENTTDVRLFDCIWLIKPGNNYMMMKTHISLRVEEFHGMAARSDLTVRQGTTSDALEIENVVWPNNGMSKETHVVPILTGYYIRLRGVFGMSSKLAIVYSVFNYLNCYIGSEFLCSNNHCISIRLHCDGFDHCGDGSDEPDTCEEDWAHMQNDRRWYSHKPNYYFPKMEQYPDLKTATGIFIISTLGIFGVLSGWMVILYRMGVRARHQRELQSHLQTISELLDRQDEDRAPDEPPSYEAPPDYEEVIKIGMEQELREPRQPRRHHRERRDRRRRREHSCSRAPSNATQSTVQSTLRRSCSLERPSTSAAAMTHAVASTDTTQDAKQLQELSNRVLMATALCGAAGPSGATAAACKPVGIPTSPSPLSPGCELSAALASEQPQSSNAGAGTSTSVATNEECTDAFRDDSLNISLTLGMPTTTSNNNSSGSSNDHSEGALTSNTRSKSNIASTSSSSSNNHNNNSNTNCTEHTYLKRSWVFVNNGTHNFKIQRLRHTFSSPEPFNVNELQLPYPDFLSYGTNLPHNRSFLQSNASNFGSELSRDPSCSCGFAKTRATQAPANANDDNSSSQRCSTGPNDMRDVFDASTHTLQNYAKVEAENHRQQLLSPAASDTDSDAEPNISCFGAVANRRHQRGNSGSSSAAGGVNKTSKNRRATGHVRSRSCTNSTLGAQQRAAGRMMIKRSSSADLLMNHAAAAAAATLRSPQHSDIDNSCSSGSDSGSGSAANEQKLFLF